MNKKTIIFIAVTIVVLLLAGMGYLIYSLNKSSEENKQMLELAEMDKREMENEYENFARQYNEMKTQVNNDSLMAQLEQEQQRTQQRAYGFSHHTVLPCGPSAAVNAIVFLS